MNNIVIVKLKLSRKFNTFGDFRGEIDSVFVWNVFDLQQPWSWCGQCSSRASWWPACWGPLAPVHEHKDRLSHFKNWLQFTAGLKQHHVEIVILWDFAMPPHNFESNTTVVNTSSTFEKCVRCNEGANYRQNSLCHNNTVMLPCQWSDILQKQVMAVPSQSFWSCYVIVKKLYICCLKGK